MKDFAFMQNILYANIKNKNNRFVVVFIAVFLLLQNLNYFPGTVPSEILYVTRSISLA